MEQKETDDRTFTVKDLKKELEKIPEDAIIARLDFMMVGDNNMVYEMDYSTMFSDLIEKSRETGE